MEKAGIGHANTLDFLLEVEAKASALVNDAQEEADRRTRNSEENLRTAYEERCRAEIQAQENAFLEYVKKVKNDYKDLLDSFRQELLQIKVNREQFRALVNEYLDKG